MAFQYKNRNGRMFTLHSMVVTLRGTGMQQRIYYFAPKAGSRAINEVPAGWKVIESKKTALPILKRK